MIGDSEYKRRLLQADKRISAMDEINGRGECLTTIYAAIEAGLKHPNTGAVYDAQVMLGRLIEDIRAGKLVCLLPGRYLQS